jgi:hypothetical protein
MKHYVAWLGCLLLLVVLTSCTSADKCTRGEPGCACTSDDGCKSGARCVEGMCVKGSKPSGGGKDSGTNDASAMQSDASNGGSGGDGGGNTNDAGGEAIDCKAKTFDAACREYCKALCASEANLCLNSTCETGFCGTDGGQLRDTCNTVCSGDVGCMQDLCSGELKRTCDQFGYVDDKTSAYVSGCFNEDPACVPNPDFGCSNICGTGPNGTGADLANNGQCEDGGNGSVSHPPCARGTDCKDCGKRTCAKQGESCMNGGDCCGFYPKMGAWCVDIDGNLATNDAVCLQDCSTQDCPSGTQCNQLEKDAGSVCVP